MSRACVVPVESIASLRFWDGLPEECRPRWARVGEGCTLGVMNQSHILSPRGGVAVRWQYGRAQRKNLSFW